MQKVILNVEESFYDHFIELIKNISKEKVQIVDNDAPAELIVSSVDEVRRRIFEAEKEKGLTEEEYEKEMDAFFQNELGIMR